MSTVLRFIVQSTNEAVRVGDLRPHLKTWKGMKRVGDREWAFEGGTLTLTYEGRLGGADLVNTVRFEGQVRDLEASDRIMKLADWLSAELGWALTSSVG
ncbi:MAG: hypothetical protein SFW67_06735 [Myxococcaceae bacterium]|nr:hypothetical protein [Myxococcaceae bacterium]